MEKNKLNPFNEEDALFYELSKLIEQNQQKIINTANNTLITLYWQVGKRINEHVLQKKRADYGKEIVSTVSTQLKVKFGKSFEDRNLRRMMQFAEQFTDFKIIGKFHAKDKGQMELYLNWLNRYERQENEGKPIGLILCAESSKEQVELLEIHKDGIVVAEYWTELPPKHLLEKQLHKSLIEAREQLERKKLINS